MQIHKRVVCRSCKGETVVQIMGNPALEFKCHLCGAQRSVKPSLKLPLIYHEGIEKCGYKRITA